MGRFAIEIPLTVSGTRRCRGGRGIYARGKFSKGRGRYAPFLGARESAIEMEKQTVVITRIEE